MTKKETVARKMGKYLESKDWNVFEMRIMCDECKKSCFSSARFCSHCGTRLNPKENQDEMIETLYQAFLVGKRAESQFDKK